MIYLIYGPDTFRSRCLLSEIIQEFKNKAGINTPAIFRFDIEEDDIGRLLQLRNTQSLFGSKELVVIERAFSSGKNTMAALEPRLAEWQKSKDALFVFWDGDLSENEAVSSVKKYAAEVREFKTLSGRELEEWLANEISQRGLKLSSQERRALLAVSGGDLWKLMNELAKHELGGLVAGRNKPEEVKMWNFTDAFLSSKKQALAASARLLSDGNDIVYLMGALGRTLRTILALSDALARKIPISAVGKKMGIRHPFVLRKQAESARKLSLETLSKNYRLLLSADENNKTGKLPAPTAFLNLFVG